MTPFTCTMYFYSRKCRPVNDHETTEAPMDQRTKGKMDRWTDQRTNVPTNQRTNGRMDGRTRQSGDGPSVAVTNRATWPRREMGEEKGLSVMRRLRFRCGRKKSHMTALANGKSWNKKEWENAKEEIYDNSSEFAASFILIPCLPICQADLLS